MRPWEINELTLTEILVLFQSLQEREGADMTSAMEQALAYNRLSPAQKLELGFRQYG